jgi:DinB superfamily
MTAKDCCKYLLEENRKLIGMYLSDLSDADLAVRPAPGANPVGWQLGHMIVGEVMFFHKGIPGVKSPEIPAGFAEKHNTDAAKAEPPKGFFKKDEYLALFNQVRAATIAALDKLTDADLDKDSGLGDFCPTVGKTFLMCADHDLQHGGQFTVLRRKLGKPVLF